MSELEDNKIKSHIRIYYLLWFILTLLFLYLRFIYFKGQESSFDLMIGYTLSLWLPLMCIFPFKGIKLHRYINKTYQLEFDSIKNEFGQYKSKDSTALIKKLSISDPILRHLYKDIKKFWIFVNFTFASICIWSFSFFIGAIINPSP